MIHTAENMIENPTKDDVARAWKQWSAAEDAWEAELKRQFGTGRDGYPDVRYTIKSVGDPGTHLRCLYIAFLESRDLWTTLFRRANNFDVVD